MKKPDDIGFMIRIMLTLMAVYAILFGWMCQCRGQSSVVAYGADSTGVKDSSGAFAAAAAAGVYSIPRGTFLLMSPITVPYSGKWIGAGSDATVLLTTNGAFNVAAPSVTIEDMTIRSLTGTDTLINVSGSGFKTGDLNLDNYYIGIRLSGGVSDRITQVTAYSAIGNCCAIYMDFAGAGCGCDISVDGTLINESNAPGSRGIVIGKVGDVTIKAQILTCAYGIMITPSIGEAEYVAILGSEIDSCGNAVWASPGPGGTINWFKMDSCWVSNCKGDGIYINHGKGQVWSLAFNNTDFMGCGANGIDLDGAYTSSVQITNSRFSGNGTCGIFIGSGVETGIVSGNTIGSMYVFPGNRISIINSSPGVVIGTNSIN